METALNKDKILKNTFYFTGVSLIGYVVNIPKSIIIGLVLSPAEYGLFHSIFIWFQYLVMVNIGLCSSAGRESAHYFGQNDKENIGIAIQNKAIFIDFSIALLIAIIFISYSFSKQNIFLISSFLLVGVTYLLNRITSYYERFNSSRNLFSGVAKANLLGSIAGPIFVVGVIYYLKVYTLFIAVIIVELVRIFYYWRKMPLGFNFNFNFAGTKQLLYSGLFFGISSLLSTLYFVIDRTFINLFLDNTIMGLYSFSLMFIMMIYSMFTNFQSISLYTINKNSAMFDKEIIFKKVNLYTIQLLLASFAIIIVAQTGYYILVNYFLVKYKDSVNIFIVLSLMIYFYALYIIPSSLLTSKLMQKEKVATLVLVAGVISAIIFNSLFLRFGWKGEGIALGTVLSQAIISGMAQFIYVKNSKTMIDIKSLVEILFITVLLIFSSGYIYYMSVNQYPLKNIILFNFIIMFFLFLMTHFYYKIHLLPIFVSWLGKRFKFES